jgi:hypothetical protein
MKYIPFFMKKIFVMWLGGCHWGGWSFEKKAC